MAFLCYTCGMKTVKKGKRVVPQVIAEIARNGEKVLVKELASRRLPLDMKLSILADVMAGDMKHRDVAIRYGVTLKAVKRIAHDDELRSILDPNLVKRRKETIEHLFYHRAVSAQEHVTEEKLQDSSALQLTTISAINFDKGRLAAGLSTENISVKSLVQDLSAQAKSLADRERELAKDLGFED